MTIKEKFSEITSYQSSNFMEWFGDMEYQDKQSKLYSKKLDRDMLDKEILSEFNPTELTLGEVYNYLNTEAKKEDYMIFYCRDNAGVLRAVGVDWSDGGWYVSAGSVGCPDRWRGGYQVFSRNFFDTQNSPSVTLELSKEEAEVLKKVINRLIQ